MKSTTQQRNTERRESRLEQAAFSERIAEHRVQLASDIRKYFQEFDKELSALPRLALQTNLIYPDCNSYAFKKNEVICSQLLLPLKLLRDDGQDRVWLALDLSTADVVVAAANVSPGPFKYTRVANDDEIHELADFCSKGSLNHEIDGLNDSGRGRLEEFECCERDDSDLYEEVRELVDALRRKLRPSRLSRSARADTTRQTLVRAIRDKIRPSLN